MIEKTMAPVLDADQRKAVLSMAHYWREVAQRGRGGHVLPEELARLVSALGYAAILELVARGVEAES